MQDTYLSCGYALVPEQPPTLLNPCTQALPVENGP
jgi:hypothetical protein